MNLQVGDTYKQFFHKGDRLVLSADNDTYEYVVYGEETRSDGIRVIVAMDEEGDLVNLNKSTVAKRVGISWTHHPVAILPEDLFTI